jgi:hypothetical protein
MRGHPFMGQLSNLYGLSPTRGSGAAYIVLRRCLATIRSNRPWSAAKMWFYRSVEEPSGTYQKRGPFGSRASPIGPVRRPVGIPLWCFRPIFGGCVRVIVPFPKNYNLHQTESGWESYAHFTEPRSVIDIFWFWTPNMAIDISVSIISMRSLQHCTLILHLECFYDALL